MVPMSHVPARRMVISRLAALRRVSTLTGTVPTSPSIARLTAATIASGEVEVRAWITRLRGRCA
jgi:hypothetical protein